MPKEGKPEARSHERQGAGAQVEAGGSKGRRLAPSLESEADFSQCLPDRQA